MLHYFVDYADYCGEHFANDYNVFASTAKGSQKFRDAFPEARRITRKEAIRLGWSRPREAKQGGPQWFGGFWTTRGGATTMDEAIADCVVATEGLMEEKMAIMEVS